MLQITWSTSSQDYHKKLADYHNGLSPKVPLLVNSRCNIAYNYELEAICQKLKIKGYHNKCKAFLVKLIIEKVDEDEMFNLLKVVKQERCEK